MVELNSDQFGAPYMTKGGQGKLFRDPKPTDAARYHKGYTPERIHEIADAPIDVQPGSTGHFSGPAGRHEVLGVIARSKTPVTDFTHASSHRPMTEDELRNPVNTNTLHAARREQTNWSGDDLWSLRIETGASNRAMSHQGRMAAGFYQRGDKFERGRIVMGSATHGSKEAAAQTLLHELGHYKSAKVEHNESADYSTPSLRGKEEAVADDNMVTRFVPDPRDVRKGRSNVRRPTYENSDAFQGLGGLKAHTPYVRARQTLSESEKRTIKKHGFRPMEHPGSSTPSMFLRNGPGEAEAYTVPWWLGK